MSTTATGGRKDENASPPKTTSGMFVIGGKPFKDSNQVMLSKPISNSGPAMNTIRGGEQYRQTKYSIPLHTTF